MEPEALSLKAAVRISEEVLFREIDGEAVLLELGTGVYFGLNEAGTRIWTLLQQDGSLRKVFEAMQTQYEVPAERLERDLLELVNQLLAKGLVVEHLPTPV